MVITLSLPLWYGLSLQICNWMCWQIPARFDITLVRESMTNLRGSARKLLNTEKLMFHVDNTFPKQVRVFSCCMDVEDPLSWVHLCCIDFDFFHCMDLIWISFACKSYRMGFQLFVISDKGLMCSCLYIFSVASLFLFLILNFKKWSLGMLKIIML